MAEPRPIRQETAELFPLPLSPFEKFVWWDADSCHPMTSFVELHFDAPLTTSALEIAYRFASQRHPLLASIIEDSGQGLVWKYLPDYSPPVLEPARLSPIMQGHPRAIDLTSETGCRMWYYADSQPYRLVIQFHHACCDGVGIRSFLVDMLSHYARLTAQTEEFESPPDRLELQRLRSRFDFSDYHNKGLQADIGGWQRLKNAYYFHFQLPTDLRGSTSKGEVDLAEQNWPLQHLTFGREQSQQIINKAKRLRIGLNDLGLAILFFTCARWNLERGHGTSSSRLRLLMPYDLRLHGDLRMPAANRMSFSFLGRRQGDCADLEMLLKRIQAEIRMIKNTRLPLDFLGGLELAAGKPRLMKWALRQSSRMATAVLTYTGDISRGLRRFFPAEGERRIIGDTRLSAILAAPPARRNTNIAMGLCVNWGRISVSADRSRLRFSSHDCQAFLQDYQKVWIDWLTQ